MHGFRLSLRSLEPRHFGSGWISGVLSAALGLIGLGAVVCFHYPLLLTMPELRELYPLPYVRALLHLVLVGAFVLGVISVSLRQNKALGVAGIVLDARCRAPWRLAVPSMVQGRRAVPRPGLVPA